MSDPEKLASVHVLQTAQAQERQRREDKRHEVEASGATMMHVLKAVVGRMKWHATILENQYGYKRPDPVPHFQAHLEMSGFAAQIEENLAADGWDTAKVREDLFGLLPTMWACYQEYEQGEPITGTFKPPPELPAPRQLPEPTPQIAQIKTSADKRAERAARTQARAEERLAAKKERAAKKKTDA